MGKNSQTARPTRVTFYDILARPLASEQSAFGAKTVRTHRVYDSLGRVSAESRPYFKTDTLKPVTSFYYDTYGRLGSVAKPDGGAISYAYGGLAETESKTTKSGGAEVTTIRYRDVLGRINRVDQALASNTWLTQRYSYDPLGVLKTSTDPNGNQIALVIDDWGRKTKQTDPDLGVWQYSYNAFGEMLTQIDAKTKTTSFEYDALGRLTKRTEPTLTSNWVYDTAANGIDKLASVTADNGTSRSLAYDAPGRVTQISTKLASSVNLKRAYDSSSGLLISEEYPNAFKLRYEYDSIGNLQRVRQWNDTAANGALYWEATAYAPTGKVSSFKLGNGITTTRAISASTGLFDSINSTNAAAKAIQAFGYKYDYVGNLLERTDTSWQSELATPAALNFKETFAYDRLNRLDTAQVAGGLLRDYDYDSLGNLTKKTDFSNKLVYGNTRPHAVSKVYSPGFESDPNKAWSYSYDANGNVSDELYGVLATRHIDYDSANYVTAVTRYKADGATVQAQQGFLYDADRMRVKETLSSNGSNKTTYVLRPETHAGGHYECDYAASACTEQRVYLQANGELFAMATQAGSNAATMQYFHTDHLGSVALVTDAAGAVAERMAFDPFGARRLLNGGADFTLKGQKTRRGYTGHDQLDELGLVHMNGRIYHPAIGRFVSPDPNVFHPDDSQDFNRYAYVHNNPLAATDPSGFAMFGLDDGALDGVFQPGLNFSFNFPSQNWSLTSEERKIERYFQNACPTSNCGGGSGPVSQQATGSSSVDAAKSQKQSNASVTAENNLGGLQQLMRWRSSESTVAPGRKMGEIEDAQTASRSFALGFVPGPGVVEGIEEFQNGKYLLGIGMIASELPGLKQLKAAKGAANVEQYALRAGESGFYPVMTRGSKEATDLKWLEKGDVWKFGTTKNPSTRYSQSYLDNIGEYGVYYSTEFKGTLQEALKLESMKIRNYIFQTGELPAGNKMIK